MLENHTYMIETVRHIQCKIGYTLRALDMLDIKPHLLDALIWQILQTGITKKLYTAVTSLNLEDDCAGMAMNQTTLFFFNSVLRHYNINRNIKNFTTDISDSVAYVYALYYLVPSKCTLEPLSIENILARAQAMLDMAKNSGFIPFITAESIVMGNQRLNTLFSTYLLTHGCSVNSEKRQNLQTVSGSTTQNIIPTKVYHDSPTPSPRNLKSSQRASTGTLLDIETRGDKIESPKGPSVDIIVPSEQSKKRANSTTTIEPFIPRTTSFDPVAAEMDKDIESQNSELNEIKSNDLSHSLSSPRRARTLSITESKKKDETQSPDVVGSPTGESMTSSENRTKKRKRKHKKNSTAKTNDLTPSDSKLAEQQLLMDVIPLVKSAVEETASLKLELAKLREQVEKKNEREKLWDCEHDEILRPDITVDEALRYCWKSVDECKRTKLLLRETQDQLEKQRIVNEILEQQAMSYQKTVQRLQANLLDMRAKNEVQEREGGKRFSRIRKLRHLSKGHSEDRHVLESPRAIEKDP